MKTQDELSHAVTMAAARLAIWADEYTRALQDQCTAIQYATKVAESYYNAKKRYQKAREEAEAREAKS